MNCIMNGAGKQSVTVRRFFDEWPLVSMVRTQYSRGIYSYVQSGHYTCEKFMFPLQPQPRDQEPTGARQLSLPLNVLRLWNWKSAILSVMLRVPVFAIATMRRGPEAVAGAILTETAVCAINAGWYAAIVQILRNRKPVWLVVTVISVIVPLSGQVIEYAIHAWHETPHRVAAVVVSTVLGAIASLFNWYAMKHGQMLVGGERSSFASDLRSMPVLLFRFFLLAPRWVGKQLGWMALPSN
jgi:hypothetical protein